jgi:hypothetical protein
MTGTIRSEISYNVYTPSAGTDEMLVHINGKLIISGSTRKMQST